MPDRLGQRKSVAVELLLDQLLVGGRLGNAARHRVQLVEIIEFQCIELAARTPAGQGYATAVDEAVELAGELAQTLGPEAERRTGRVQQGDLLLHLRQQDRGFGGKIEHPVDHPSGDAQQLVIAGARWSAVFGGRNRCVVPRTC